MKITKHKNVAKQAWGICAAVLEAYDFSGYIADDETELNEKIYTVIRIIRNQESLIEIKND